MTTRYTNGRYTEHQLNQLDGEQLAFRIFGPRVRELWSRGWWVYAWQDPDGTCEFVWEVWDRMFKIRTVDDFHRMYWEILLCH